MGSPRSPLGHPGSPQVQPKVTRGITMGSLGGHSGSPRVTQWPPRGHLGVTQGQIPGYPSGTGCERKIDRARANICERKEVSKNCRYRAPARGGAKNQGCIPNSVSEIFIIIVTEVTCSQGKVENKHFQHVQKGDSLNRVIFGTKGGSVDCRYLEAEMQLVLFMHCSKINKQ